MLKSTKKINLYKRILGVLIKKGKRGVASQILRLALKDAAPLVKLHPKVLLLRVFIKLSTFIEVKLVKIKRREHLVPFTTGTTRRLFLVAKWLYKAVLSNKSKIPSYKKLSKEMQLILSRDKNFNENKSDFTYASHALELKRKNDKSALSVRSNLHFRW